MALVSGTALPLRLAQGTQAARGWLSSLAQYADTQWLLGGSSNPTGWRQQHQLVTRPSPAQSVVPEHILQELREIGEQRSNQCIDHHPGTAHKTSCADACHKARRVFRGPHVLCTQEMLHSGATAPP